MDWYRHGKTTRIFVSKFRHRGGSKTSNGRPEDSSSIASFFFSRYSIGGYEYNWPKSEWVRGIRDQYEALFDVRISTLTFLNVG